MALLSLFIPIANHKWLSLPRLYLCVVAMAATSLRLVYRYYPTVSMTSTFRDWAPQDALAQGHGEAQFPPSSRRGMLAQTGVNGVTSACGFSC